MSVETYLVIDTIKNPKVCDDAIMWDGVSNWPVPTDHILVKQATTPALNWGVNSTSTQWILVESVGTGGIGYTWDGTRLTTNQPMPTTPPTPD